MADYLCTRGRGFFRQVSTFQLATSQQLLRIFTILNILMSLSMAFDKNVSTFHTGLKFFIVQAGFSLYRGQLLYIILLVLERSNFVSFKWCN